MVSSTEQESVIRVGKGESVALPVTADYIGFAKEQKLLDLLSGENLMFADKVKKTNKHLQIKSFIKQWEESSPLTSAFVFRTFVKFLTRYQPQGDIGITEAIIGVVM